MLAGAGQDESLADAALRVPSRHAVVMLPFIPDVRPLYELLELVLLPSRMEGFSQALLEAMALGKPVIASAAAGNLDLVAAGVDGLLVSPSDPAAWAGAIERVLGDPAWAAASAPPGAGRPARPSRSSAPCEADCTGALSPRAPLPRPYRAARFLPVRLIPGGADVVRVSGFTIVRNAIKLDFPAGGEHPVAPAGVR